MFGADRQRLFNGEANSSLFDDVLSIFSCDVDSSWAFAASNATAKAVGLSVTESGIKTVMLGADCQRLFNGAANSSLFNDVLEIFGCDVLFASIFTVKAIGSPSVFGSQIRFDMNVTK